MEPCKVESPGDCEVIHDSVTKSTIDTLEPVSEFLKDFYLEVGFIQDTVNLKNFTNPISRNLIWKQKLQFHSEQMTQIRFEFS